MNEVIPPELNEKFLKPYSPIETESRIYKAWEDSGYFNPDFCIENGVTDDNADYFSIVLPPPNVTGILHMGSAFMLAIQDTIVRAKRMQGKKTLWIPGTDHAAIATQSVVEKKLEKEEDKRKYDLGREEFLRRVNEFAEESKKTILHQARGMGASLDWSREAYTLDEKRSLAVRTAFKRMYDEGLIYRGNRVINWDPKAQTTISDDEIVYEERDAVLYTFKYSKDFPISISTTRPETKFGDTAVAVNPDDERYKEFVGQIFNIEFFGEPLAIKIVGDRAVDKEFGTGALGVTPAHSPIDADLALRHELDSKQVINEYGKMTIGPEGVKDSKTAEARKMIVELIREAGLMEKEENIKQNISTSERSGAIIEPLPKLQWFVAVNKKFERDGNETSLKEMMLDAIRKDSIAILPDRFEKIYFNWIENLRDWCISRQIWFGHRIPVWYKNKDKENEEIYVGIDAPENAEGNGWEQDSDTLDTWFSSGLWTFSTLGWPNEESTDLKNYHPTIFLETAYDILFFWVARMILMSKYHLNAIPFKKVYLHGLVRDAQGRKISKSLGNNIDPLDMISKYGADAVRMSLIVGTGPGSDSRVSEEKIKAYKNFANKLWNIARFIITNTADIDEEALHKAVISSSDEEILNDFQKVAKEISGDINEYRLHLASEKLYHYIWHNFADIILEKSKIAIKEGGDRKVSSQKLLIEIFTNSLKILHPFMPYVTEEIWQLLPGKFKRFGNAEIDNREFLMISRWPV
jgi:valyl-tRNA synthetase